MPTVERASLKPAPMASTGANTTGELVAHHMAGVKMPNMVGFNGIL